MKKDFVSLFFYPLPPPLELRIFFVFHYFNPALEGSSAIPFYHTDAQDKGALGLNFWTWIRGVVLFYTLDLGPPIPY